MDKKIKLHKRKLRNVTDRTKKLAKVRTKKVSVRPPGAMARLGCEMLRFDFDVDLDSFDLDAFYNETGLSSNDPRWSTVFYARKRNTAYHVHFDGSVINGKRLDLTLTYYDKSVTPPKTNGPYAETVMKWIGSFFRVPRFPALTASKFSKPLDAWSSRFNLPFKVTMKGSNAEVTIDGIALDLPKNPQHALRGTIGRTAKEWNASIVAGRLIEFGTFDISKEILIHNEALKIFIEESK